MFLLVCGTSAAPVCGTSAPYVELMFLLVCGTSALPVCGTNVPFVCGTSVFVYVELVLLLMWN